jgi:hypothetical protein
MLAARHRTIPSADRGCGPEELQPTVLVKRCGVLHSAAVMNTPRSPLRARRRSPGRSTHEDPRVDWIDIPLRQLSRPAIAFTPREADDGARMAGCRCTPSALESPQVPHPIVRDEDARTTSQAGAGEIPGTTRPATGAISIPASSTSVRHPSMMQRDPGTRMHSSPAGQRSPPSGSPPWAQMKRITATPA